MKKLILSITILITFFLIPNKVLGAQEIDGIIYPSISDTALNTVLYTINNDLLNDWVNEFNFDTDLILIYRSSVTWTRGGVTGNFMTVYCNDFDTLTSQYPDYFKYLAPTYVIEQDSYTIFNQNCELYPMSVTASSENEIETVNQMANFNDYNQTHQPGQTVNTYGATTYTEWNNNKPAYIAYSNQEIETNFTFLIPEIHGGIGIDYIIESPDYPTSEEVDEVFTQVANTCTIEIGATQEILGHISGDYDIYNLLLVPINSYIDGINMTYTLINRMSTPNYDNIVCILQNTQTVLLEEMDAQEQFWTIGMFAEILEETQGEDGQNLGFDITLFGETFTILDLNVQGVADIYLNMRWIVIIFLIFAEVNIVRKIVNLFIDL